MHLAHNLVQLAGRIGLQAPLYFLSDGTPFVRLRLYQDEVDGSGRSVSHSFSITAWGKLAEALHQKVRRGDRLFVQGKLRVLTYQQPGGKQLRPEVQLTSFHVLERRDKGGGACTPYGAAQTCRQADPGQSPPREIPKNNK